MEVSHLLARVFGPYLLLVSAGLLLNRKSYLEMLDEYPHNRVVIVGFGVVSLLMGLLLLQFHNIWSADWRALITVFIWMMTLKGAVALVYPPALEGISKSYQGNERLLTANAAATLCFGLLLTYVGYFG